MKSLIFCAALLAAAVTAAPGIKTLYTIPMGGVPTEREAAGGAGMFYAQIDGHSIGWNLTTQEKQFDFAISGGQVQCFLPLDSQVLIATESGVLSFSHKGDFMWDSGDVNLESCAQANFRVQGSTLYHMSNPGSGAFDIAAISLADGTAKHHSCNGAIFDGDDTIYFMPESGGFSFSGSGLPVNSLIKWDIKTNTNTTICSGDDLPSMFAGMKDSNTAVMMHSHEGFEHTTTFVSTHDVSKNCAMMSSTPGLRGVNSWEYGPVIAGDALVVSVTLHSNQNFEGKPGLETYLFANLSTKISNYTLASNAQSQSIYGSYSAGVGAMIFGQKNLLIVDSTTGMITEKEGCPFGPGENVVDVGGALMVPNLMGYTIWTPDFGSYQFRNEHMPPSTFVPYMFNGATIGAFGSNIVAWKWHQ